MLPRISLITVCYNAENSVAGALQSVRVQSYRGFEVIIVDGASKDHTVDVVNQFNDLPMSVSSEPDKGIYDAMNKGIARAQGDILFFLNADDRLFDMKVLEDVVHVFDTNLDVDLVYGNVVNVFSDGDVLHTNHSHITPRTLLYGSLCHQSVFAKKSLFSKYGCFNIDFPICADFDWFLRVMRGGVNYLHIERNVATFARGGMHEQNWWKTYWEKARIRRQFLQSLPYVLGETFLYLKTKRVHVARFIKLILCKSIPQLGRCERCQRLMRRTGAAHISKKSQ